MSGELEVGVTVLPLAENSPLAFSELDGFRCAWLARNSRLGRDSNTLAATLHQQPVVMLQKTTFRLPGVYELRLTRLAWCLGGGTSGQWDFLLSHGHGWNGNGLAPRAHCWRDYNCPARWWCARCAHRPDGGGWGKSGCLTATCRTLRDWLAKPAIRRRVERAVASRTGKPVGCDTPTVTPFQRRKA